MAATPSALGKRYAPLVALAVVQVLLVALAPSNGGNGFASSPSAISGTGSGSGSTGGTTTGGTPGSTGGTSSGGAAGSTGGTSSGGTAGSTGGTSTGGSAGSTGALVANPGCVNGRQAGPTFYMPACTTSYPASPTASMQGVTPTQINFVYYLPQGNAEVSAILSAENLAASPSQQCVAIQAFTNELNKRWELYGRKFNSLDGSGNQSGSAEGGSGCHFAFFQGQCSLTPPDIPCYQAEADTIAAMKPAFVVAPAVYPDFYFRLAHDHVVVAGGSSGAENIPESYYDQLAPYFYNVFPSGTQTVRQLAEFYCKKLVGKPVQFAGTGPGDVIPTLGPAPIRKLGIGFPSNNGDTTIRQVADLLTQLVAQCGATGTQEFSYSSDVTTAQTQSNTAVAGIKNAHITTVICLCDPIAPVFFTNTLDQQQYHPEFLIPGSGLLDVDTLAQLYNQNEMKYAFGPSEITDAMPFADSDAVKAWQDAGNAGEPDQTQNLNWAYFALMGTIFQLAGPAPTPQSIRAGMSSISLGGGDHFHALLSFQGPFPWTAIKDFREVYYCPSATSPINGHLGAYLSAFAGQRFVLNQLASGTAELFPGGPCA